MAKSKATSNIKVNPVWKTVSGLVLIGFSFFLFLAFISFFKNWKDDQSQLGSFFDREAETKNLLGKFGSFISDLLIFESFGFAAFILPILLFCIGYYLVLRKKLFSNNLLYSFSSFGIIWLPILLGFIFPESILCGVFGFELNDFLSIFIGNIGIIILLFVSLLVFISVVFKITPKVIEAYFAKIQNDFDERKLRKEAEKNQKDSLNPNVTASNPENKIIEDQKESLQSNPVEQTKGSEDKEETKSQPEFKLEVSDTISSTKEEESKNDDDFTIVTPQEEKTQEDDDGFTIVTPQEEKIESFDKEADEINKKSSELVDEIGEYDPKLDLSEYQYPGLSSLENREQNNIKVDPSELESNKDKIVETLRNYKIEISKIKATIGPTVTLYEIVPAAGIRISKIKSLEDDIALSLAALGIRIIAPIPGKGTIGIEVPNKAPSIVSIKSVLSSEKFQNTKMLLPVALGKTISNETYVADLAKMPHLLMAGATGQGKSVGLNVILASLLYKKHPAEVKFVLVDPKKVELTLFSKIERHYLAKLPDSEESIITDNDKVINTLNSLCIEMDERYELLKVAMVRNIVEYNEKFKKRKLNPENGHRFLPYIVLVVDEFADLIMTAGKEVEVPIARLAQLARAIGIHLIIATQRPSVNVITGIIKANFPSRIAFRVTSKIDSRTILDAGGADQLIGRGDMLYSNGGNLIRIQCAFIDTPEVEDLTDFIGSQRGYTEPYLLPEYSKDEGSSDLEDVLNDKDALFDEAARTIVLAQQGSASLLQRKLKLGYNRAGRLIDQLEAAGIVGPFEGSKARQVLVSDPNALEDILKSLN